MVFKVDRFAAKSLTAQICDGYRAAILDGRLPAGARFPTCREIAAGFGVSMIVSSRVVKTLGDEGLIRARPHLGSVVAPCREKNWRGRVIFVNAGGVCSAYANVLSAELRERLTAADYLFSVVDLPSRFIAPSDTARLAVHLADRPSLVIALHARPEVLDAVTAAGVACLVVDDGVPAARFRPGRFGRLRTDYRAAVAAFVRHCTAAGVKRVWEAGFEPGYASAAAALRRAGVSVETIRVAETPAFRFSGEVQRAGFAAFDARLSAVPAELPDAVYVTDDYLAAGALLAFARHGVRLPRDVRFASLATKGFEPVWWQSVTRIEWDWTSCAAQAAGCALQMLGHPGARPDAVLSPLFTVGETFPVSDKPRKRGSR